MMTYVSGMHAHQLKRRVDRKQVRRIIRNSIKRQERFRAGALDSQTAKTSVAVKVTRPAYYSKSLQSGAISELTTPPSCAPDARQDDDLPEVIHSITWRTSGEEEEKVEDDVECPS